MREDDYVLGKSICLLLIIQKENHFAISEGFGYKQKYKVMDLKRIKTPSAACNFPK